MNQFIHFPTVTFQWMFYFYRSCVPRKVFDKKPPCETTPLAPHHFSAASLTVTARVFLLGEVSFISVALVAQQEPPTPTDLYFLDYTFTLSWCSSEFSHFLGRNFFISIRHSMLLQKQPNQFLSLIIHREFWLLRFNYSCHYIQIGFIFIYLILLFWGKVLVGIVLPIQSTTI